MQINGKRTIPTHFLELLSSADWQLEATNQIYTAIRETREEKIKFWVYVGDLIEYIRPYWPKRITYREYRYLSVEDWQYEFDSTTNFVQIRKKGQRAIALWIPYNEIKGWGTLQEGQEYIYPLRATIYNQKVIQGFDEYQQYQQARDGRINTTNGENIEEEGTDCWQAITKHPAHHRCNPCDTRSCYTLYSDTEPEWQEDDYFDEILDCQTETETTISITSLLEDYYRPGEDRTGPQTKETQEEGLQLYPNTTNEPKQQRNRWYNQKSPYERLGEYIYDDENGCDFGTYDQRCRGTEIPEEEVFWAAPENRKEEAEKYKRRRQYEAEWYEEQSRQLRGYSPFENGEPDYYPPYLDNQPYSPEYCPNSPSYNGPSGYQIAGNYVPDNVRLFNKRELTAEPWWTY